SYMANYLTHTCSNTDPANTSQSLNQQGHFPPTVTKLKPAIPTPQTVAGGVLSVDLNTLLYSFGFPMLVALTLAAGQPHALRTLVIAYAVLVPFVTWGIVAEFLKHIVFDAGPGVASQTGFTAPQRELIAFAYQFGVLILPTVAPAVFWVLTHRRFLEGFAGRASVAAQ